MTTFSNRALEYDEWITYVFDHDDPEWHWEDDAPFWNEETHWELTVDHLTKLFEDPTPLLDSFTPAQIGAGIHFLVEPACSSHAYAFRANSVPLDRRIRGLRAISNLYAQCFARICRWVLGTTQRELGGGGPEDCICYMFWDVFPFYGKMSESPAPTGKDAELWPPPEDAVQLEDACLWAMEKTAELANPCCVVGGLHGLGHWALAYPERTSKAIAGVLRRDLPPEVLDYARRARTGDIQ
ncbi:MAG: hypothetical protein IH851_05120 [Armatimonadetes bacterium]|nr:hypothetical protein [Armatimonadota bacterium]